MTPTARARMDRLIARVRVELELRNNAHVPYARMVLVLSASAWRLLADGGATGVFSGVRVVVEMDGESEFEILEIQR